MRVKLLSGFSPSERIHSCNLMPDNRRVQGPEVSQSPAAFLKAAEKREKPDLLDEKGCRVDGRKADEIRPIYMKTGLNPSAAGSAYVELGTTKVMCAIYGPKEVPHKEDTPVQGRLTCEFKFAPFSCHQRRQHQQDQEEKEYSGLIVQALSRAVQLRTFPKLQLEINVLVVENGGNALGTALLSASMALATSGVKMLDLPLATSVVQYKSQYLVDPTLTEEEGVSDGQRGGGAGGHVTVVYLSSLDEVTAVKQNGCMLPDNLMTSVDVCIEGCLRLKQRMKTVLCT